MNWMFPELPGPSVFLASPGDLAYMRGIVASELRDLKQQMADDQGLQLYTWNVDKAKDGFDDDLPAQLQIPLPTGTDCKAVICLFGEKIGTPLPAEFPLNALDGLNVLDESLQYRLVHPWQPSAAKDGGFPLTGTTFEYLAAMATNRQLRLKGSDNTLTKLFLRFVGDQTIRDPHVPPTKANWGGNLLRRDARIHFGDDQDALFDWIANNREQLVQLRNFVLYLEQQGVVVQTVADADDARAQLRQFLVRRLDLRVARSNRNPFKGLEVFDVADEHVFFGRTIERDDAVKRFHAVWNDAEKPSSFGITGGSGVGKSSFMRAGVVARLCKENGRGKLLDCVLRPGDMLRPGEPQDRTLLNGHAHSLALRRLLLRCYERVVCKGVPADELPVMVSALVADFDAIRFLLRPAWVVRRLLSTLADYGDGASILIGIDQFEEIVDQRADPRLRPYWESVAEFLSDATKSGRIGLIYTLQANRVGLIAEDPILGPLWANGDQRSLVFPEQSLGEIVREPFRCTPSMEIAPDLVEALSDRISDFKNRASGGDVQGSLLPLVSLSLRRIHERRAMPLVDELLAERRARESEVEQVDDGAPTATDGTGRDVAPEHRPTTVTLTVENCSGYLNVEDAIGELADEALAEAKAASGPDWSETTLGDLLRRLVELHGQGRNQFGLPDAAVPTTPALRRLATSLRGRRLLLEDNHGRIRLVHEAVLRYWGAARTWLQAERPLLDDAAALQANALPWHSNHERSRDFLLRCGSAEEVDRAARILIGWYDIFTDPTMLRHRESMALLHDYALEQLRAHPEPGRIVDENPKRPTHLMIVTSYGLVDIVREFVERDPASVHQPRADNRTPIFVACLLGNEPIVQIFLEHGADVKQIETDGWRPVHAAATGGHVNCMERLLEKGATLDSEGTPAQTTPLHLAARNGHADMIRYLVNDCGLRPSLTDANKWTPLHLAASLGQPEAVRALSDLGAVLDATLELGWTPLHLASRDNKVEATDALLAAGAHAEQRLYNDWTPLHLAAQRGWAPIARALLAAGADAGATAVNDWSKKAAHEKKVAARDPSKRGAHNDAFDWQPLHVAADAGQAGTVTLLVRAGASVDARTAGLEGALHLAARKGFVRLIEPMAELQADFQLRNASSHTPLQVALENDQFDFVAALVRSGAVVDATVTDKGTDKTDAWTALHLSAHEGKAERAGLLLGLGANGDAGNAEGRTPLHLAAARGAVSVVERLLEHGVRVDETANDGTIALHLACLAGHGAVVARLAESGANVTKSANDAVTPLHMAAGAGHVQVVDMLLAREHPVDCVDSDGWMPLHVAAQRGDVAVVRSLLQARADPNVVTKRPAMTPLQAAAEVGHAGVVEALLDVGCDIETTTGMRGAAIALALKHGHDDVALRLVEHGARLDRLDPVSGQSLIELHCLAGEHRLQANLPVPGNAARVLEAFRLAGVATPDEPEFRGDPDLPGVSTSAPTKKTSVTGRSDQPGAAASSRFGNVTTYPWVDVPPDVVPGLLERLEPVDGKYHVSATATECSQSTLPWYAGYHLYRLKDASWPKKDLILYYLEAPGGNLYRLNGTSPPIHAVNKQAPIALDENNVLDYLGFFLFFVRGDEGPFYLAESIDDPMLPDNPVVRAVLDGTLRPATFEGRDHRGFYLCDAVVYYSNACFIANFAVQPGGMVNMLNDEPIAGDLPAKIDAPIA